MDSWACGALGAPLIRLLAQSLPLPRLARLRAEAADRFVKPVRTPVATLRLGPHCPRHKRRSRVVLQEGPGVKVACCFGVWSFWGIWKKQGGQNRKTAIKDQFSFVFRSNQAEIFETYARVAATANLPLEPPRMRTEQASSSHRLPLPADLGSPLCWAC